MDFPSPLAGSLAVAVAALSSVATFLNPQERSSNFRNSGAKYGALRNTARIFREVGLLSERTVQEKEKKLLQIAQERDELNESCLDSDFITQMFRTKKYYLKARFGVS